MHATGSNVKESYPPVTRFLTFERTKAAPLPGFTCKNSTSLCGTPSTKIKLICRKEIRGDELVIPISKVIPFLKSAVVSRNTVLEFIRGLTAKNPFCIKAVAKDNIENTMIAAIIEDNKSID